MVANSPRQGSVAKFERDLCSGVDGYRLKEEEDVSEGRSLIGALQAQSKRVGRGGVGRTARLGFPDSRSICQDGAVWKGICDATMF